jgi:hypothetical protein
VEGNLGASERRKRLAFGIFSLIAAFGLALSGRVSSFYGWVILFMLFWLGALGLFQAKEKT